MSNLICYDSQGKYLKKLYQWDTNQTITISGIATIPTPIFHFTKGVNEEALVVNPSIPVDSTNTVRVNIPNILLQTSGTLYVYMVELTDANGDSEYEGIKTTHLVKIPVVARPQPADYEYEENIDYESLATINARLSTVIAGLTNADNSSVAAEVIDMRTTNSGVAYSTAGDYIRTVDMRLTVAETALDNIKILEETKLDDTDNSVKNNNIVDKAVTTDKIDTKAITAPKIAEGAIWTEHIKNSSVTGDKIEALSISKSHLATDLQEEILSKLDISICSYGTDLADCTDENKIYYFPVGLTTLNGTELDSIGAGDYVGFIKRVESGWLFISSGEGNRKNNAVIRTDGTIKVIADTEPVENGTNYITSGAVYKSISDIVTSFQNENEETKELISKIPKFSIEVVDELPAENISTTTVYLVRSNDSSQNIYTEYIFVDSEERTDWEKLGEQAVDLNDYIKNVDYATVSKAGIVQGDNKVVFNEGKISCETMDLDEIENGNSSNFISAGSLKTFYENNKYDDTELKNEITQVNESIDKLFTKKELLVNLSSFKDESTGEYKNVGRYYYNPNDKILGISNDSNYACIPVELKAGIYSVQNIHPYYSFYILNNNIVRFGSAETSFISTTFELPIDTTLYVSLRVVSSLNSHETVAIASGDTIPDDISTLGVFSYDTSMKLDSVKKLEEKIPNVLTVKKDGTGDFSTLKEAVDYSRSHSDLTIQVYEGTYDLIEEFGGEYFANLTTISQRQGLQIGNGVHLIFSSGSKVVCHYQGDNEAVKTCFSPFNFAQGTKGFTLENLTLEASNVRYAIHDEGGSKNTPNMYRNVYKNCKITIDNSNNEVWKKHTCIGGGLGLHGEIIIENCCFTDMYNVGAKVSTVSYHNAVTEGAKSRIIVTGCYFSDNATFRLSYYGNSTEITEAYVSNCSMTCEPYVTAESSSYTIENVKLIMWNNTINDGASYTAGNGIKIENNVISLNLPIYSGGVVE